MALYMSFTGVSPLFHPSGPRRFQVWVHALDGPRDIPPRRFGLGSVSGLCWGVGKSRHPNTQGMV